MVDNLVEVKKVGLSRVVHGLSSQVWELVLADWGAACCEVITASFMSLIKIKSALKLENFLLRVLAVFSDDPMSSLNPRL